MKNINPCSSALSFKNNPVLNGLPLYSGRVFFMAQVKSKKVLNSRNRDVTYYEKISNEDVIREYGSGKSIWVIAKEYGMCGQSVYERLVRLGINKLINIITYKDLARIADVYRDGFIRGDNRLNELAVELGRTKQFIARQAGKMGFTNYNRPITDENKQKISVRSKKWIAENGHPKGFLGKHRTDEEKVNQSKLTKSMWADPNSKFNSPETRQLHSDYMSKFMVNRNNGKSENTYSRTKKGWREFPNGKKYFFRSKWEMNYAKYLQFLKENGNIKEWTYEEDTFWFNAIKRGVRSYTPDFKVTENNGTIIYHEVKGWMDDKSKTKLSRMKKYYPDVKMKLVDEKCYNQIKKNGKLFNFE